MEACRFRDAYEDFMDVGAQVIGVSGDSPRSHKAFAKKNRLPFRLLSDRKAVVRKAWGVPRLLVLFPGRVTYVLDAEGVVRHVFNDNTHPERHIKEALRVIRTLAG